MMIRPLLGQPGYRIFQRGSCIAVQPGAIDGAVQVTADEIIGRGVAQVDGDTGDTGQVAKLRIAGHRFQLQTCNRHYTPLSRQLRAATPMLSARRRAPCDSGEWLAVNKYSCMAIVGAHGRRCKRSGEPEAAVNGSTTAMPAPASTSERAI